MRKRLPWFEVLITIVFLSATIYAAFSDAYNLPNRWFIRDDAYYYFKVAQNISEGRGSTFDGIHPTNGYHPLWLLICIPIFALARYDLILPLRILALVTGALQIATALLLYRLVRRAISPPAGMLVAAYWAFNSYILLFLYKTGVESSISLLLIVLLLNMLYQMDTGWPQEDSALPKIALLGIVALLTTFGRLDLVFMAIVVGIWIIFRGSGLRYLLSLDILAVVVATIAAFLWRLGFSAYYDASTAVEVMLGAAIVIKIPTLYMLRLYDPPSRWDPLKVAGRLLLAVACSSALLAALLLGGSSLGLLPPFSRIILLLDAALSLGLFFLIRAVTFAMRTRRRSTENRTPLQELGARGKRWLTEGSVYYGIVGAGLLGYMVWNRLAFGTFTPVSGQIKHWWGTFTHSIYGTNATSWLSFFALNPFSDFNAWAPASTELSDRSNNILYKAEFGFGNPQWQQNFVWVLAIAVAVVALILLLRKKKSVRAIFRAGLIPLFVGSWLQILAYNATGYASPKEWYWLTEQLFLVLVGAALVNVVIEILHDQWAYARILVWIFVAWACVRSGYAYWRDTVALNPYWRTPAGTPLVDVIPFIENVTRPGDIVGMTGGGNVGYLMPSRVVVNMDGLSNSNEYFQALQARTGADYLYNSGMRYVFANPDLLSANPYRGQYDDRLKVIFQWGGKDLMRLLPAPGGSP